MIDYDDKAGQRADGDGPAMTLWTGRSGRRYVLTCVEGATSVMVYGRLYVLVHDGAIAWAGTAEDLVGDQTSRARFRGASASGAQLLWMPAPHDAVATMTLVWDLEGSRDQSKRDAA